MSERSDRRDAYQRRLALIRESLRRNDVEWAAMDIEWLLDELYARERQVRMISEVFDLDAESVGRLMWAAARGGDPTAEEFVALEEKRRVSLTVFAHALLLALSDRVRDCTMERARALTQAAKMAPHPTIQKEVSRDDP